MSQHYSNPSRENDPHALPDVEVFYARAGELGLSTDADPYAEPEANEAGWYYWFYFPGCLPDGDPIGPFSTRDEAIADAQEGNE